MVQLYSTADVSTQHGVKCLVYSRAGFGKTFLCSTAPYPIILSAESGLLSLRKFHLPYIPIATYHQLQDAYRWATQSYEAQQFWTICLDSVTEIAEVVLANEKLTNKDPRKAYLETQDQMTALLRSFRDIQGKHVYFSAKQEMNKDSMTGQILNGPMMPGNKLPQHVPYFFDEIFQIVVGKDNLGNEFRALRTRPDYSNEAKDRSGVLDEWEPADLNYIFDKIMRG